jgi:N-acetylglucosaminyl-diphospho-decaprenol L-rhamnosyltransferase
MSASVGARPDSMAPAFSLSVVSHDQRSMILNLLGDLKRIANPTFEVILTINIGDEDISTSDCAFPVRVIRNANPKGFGANHNAAFESSRGDLFVVVNPDIRVTDLNLDALGTMFTNPDIGGCAPLVLNSLGEYEDSARRFPSLGKMIHRFLFRKHTPDYPASPHPFPVDWVAGMFIVFRRAAFQDVGGFDAQRYFMYYEDVDICARLRQRGWTVWVQPATSVIHDAQRASRREFKHLRWHLTSALRYLSGV